MDEHKYQKHCEYCNKLFSVDKKSQFNKRRYCSHKCANLDPAKRKRTSITLKNSPSIKKHFTEKGRNALREGAAKRAKERHDRWLDSPAKVNNGWGGNRKCVELDISNRQLTQYRQIHTVCEICGREETVKSVGSNKPIALASDHDHQTGKFRGVLCRRCNRALGWYDNYKDNILRYLAKE